MITYSPVLKGVQELIGQIIFRYTLKHQKSCINLFQIGYKINGEILWLLNDLKMEVIKNIDI